MNKRNLFAELTEGFEALAEARLLLIPNAQTIEAMKEARAGKLQSFNTIDDLMADLNADD